MIWKDELDKTAFQVASLALNLRWLNQNTCPKNYGDDAYIFGISKADPAAIYSVMWEKNGIQDIYTHIHINVKPSLSLHNLQHWAVY